VPADILSFGAGLSVFVLDCSYDLGFSVCGSQLPRTTSFFENWPVYTVPKEIASVANSLCPAKQKRTMCEPTAKIGNPESNRNSR
jgi:hypothetical protein